MLAGKCWFFAFISESQQTTLKVFICDSSFGPAETFEFLTGLTLLVIGNGTLPTALGRQSPKLLTAIGSLQV